MGESSVLFHSYSLAAPLSRHQDNAIQALSESVSFGRFMTENLEWGKWSSFSHNKYVDEAEKFSQPGSVAQKKAFFDAYYKRIADAAKKPKASYESEESVAVLLNTLDTFTKGEVNEEDEEAEIKSVVVAVLEQEEEEEDVAVDKPVVVDMASEQEDDNTIVLDDKELLKKSGFVVENEEETSFVTTNSSVIIEKSTILEVSDKATELCPKIRERKVTNMSMTKGEKHICKRFRFLRCLIGKNTKTRDQNTTRNKRKADKKPNKLSLCLCFKPEMFDETETQRKNL
ncbi:unnamed protein product [Cochlearia groenlandica]